MAPEANILLVEAPNDLSLTTLLSAIHYASTQPGVAVVSMSWGYNEFSGESSSDHYFQPKSSTNPSGSNPGVAFVAASGDSGAYSPPFNPGIYPAVSPYVMAVGGTSLNLTSTHNYLSESGWAGSGGGAANYEGEPSYQYNQPSIGSPDVEVYNFFTGTYTLYSARLDPDVAYNANPNTGYAVYDSTPYPAAGFPGGWIELGGTSAGAPQWSALVALADQQRAAHGGKSLDTNQVETTLYNTLGTTNYSKIFHDITSGSNGYSGGAGYDVVTGLGTPIANNLVPFLAGTTVPQGQLPGIKGSGYVSSSALGSFSTGGLFSSTSGAARAGGGLFSNSGSVTLTPVTPDANGQTTNALPIPSALPVTSSSPTATETISMSTSASNVVGTVAMLTQAAPAAANGSASSAAATSTSAAQSDILLGASGWKGSALSWWLSSQGQNRPNIDEHAPDDLFIDQEEATGTSADNALASSGQD